MRFTQAAGYGISAAAYLASASAGDIVSNTVICDALQMPNRFVLQIMRMLVNAGIVSSVRGRDGGYKLAKPAIRISLLEIIEAIDGALGANDAVDLAGMSKESQAKVDHALATIEAETHKRLAAVTLADLKLAKAA